MGLLGIVVPTQYGGVGGDYHNYIDAVRMLSSACATTGVILSAHVSLCVAPILEFGTEEQKAKLRGAIKFFSGDKNNIAINVKNNEQTLPCGAIYLTEEILNEFEQIVGKENIML